MLKKLFGIFFFITLSFAQTSGASSDKVSIESLYNKELLKRYKEISPLKDLAKKEKKTYIISALLALVVFILFTKYFKLLGFFVSLLMIASGAYVLYNSSKNIVDYQTHFKRDIISKISKECCGFEFLSSRGFSKETLRQSKIFAPDIDQFNSIDIYKSDRVKFGFIVATFKTKESASVERFNKNRFEGFLIVIDSKSSSEGVAVSNTLKSKVANMDIVFNSFFSDAKRSEQRGEWSIYGDISKEDFDKIDSFGNKDIAISFLNDKIYIAIYHQGNPLEVDVMDEFSLKRAKEYQDIFLEIKSLVKPFI